MKKYEIINSDSEDGKNNKAQINRSSSFYVSKTIRTGEISRALPLMKASPSSRNILKSNMETVKMEDSMLAVKASLPPPQPQLPHVKLRAEVQYWVDTTRWPLTGVSNKLPSNVVIDCPNSSTSENDTPIANAAPAACKDATYRLPVSRNTNSGPPQLVYINPQRYASPEPRGGEEELSGKNNSASQSKKQQSDLRKINEIQEGFNKKIPNKVCHSTPLTQCKLYKAKSPELLKDFNSSSSSVLTANYIRSVNNNVKSKIPNQSTRMLSVSHDSDRLLRSSKRGSFLDKSLKSRDGGEKTSPEPAKPLISNGCKNISSRKRKSDLSTSDGSLDKDVKLSVKIKQEDSQDTCAQSSRDKHSSSKSVQRHKCKDTRSNASSCVRDTKSFEKSASEDFKKINDKQDLSGVEISRRINILDDIKKMPLRKKNVDLNRMGVSSRRGRQGSSLEKKTLQDHITLNNKVLESSRESSSSIENDSKLNKKQYFWKNPLKRVIESGNDKNSVDDGIYSEGSRSTEGLRGMKLMKKETIKITRVQSYEVVGNNGLNYADCSFNHTRTSERLYNKSSIHHLSK